MPPGSTRISTLRAGADQRGVQPLGERARLAVGRADEDGELEAARRSRRRGSPGRSRPPGRRRSHQRPLVPPASCELCSIWSGVTVVGGLHALASGRRTTRCRRATTGPAGSRGRSTSDGQHRQQRDHRRAAERDDEQHHQEFEAVRHPGPVSQAVGRVGRGGRDQRAEHEPGGSEQQEHGAEAATGRVVSEHTRRIAIRGLVSVARPS